jgi:hypothetical protein
LEYYEPQFEQLRAAAARPESRFPVRYQDGASARLPHVQLIRTAAQLNALRLVAHLEMGDSAAAYEDFRLGLRFYTALGNEATLIAGLVRWSVLALVENGIWSGLVHRQWGAPELEKIGADLAQVTLAADYALSLNSERGFSNLIYDQLAQKGTGELANLLRVNPSAGGGDQPARFLFSLYPTGWLRLNQTRTNRYFDDMLARVSQEPPRIHTERPVSSIPEDMAQAGKIEHTRYLLFFLMVPALSDIERNFAYAQTLLDETRIGCALELHRLARGSFPASLDALVPAFLPALPRDVMTGEPLHYRPGQAGDYLLYAVGWNRQDDGGKFDPKASYPKQQADWVWTMPAK